MRAVIYDISDMTKKKALWLLNNINSSIEQGYYVILTYSGKINSGWLEYVKSRVKSRVNNNISHYNLDNNKDIEKRKSFSKFLLHFEKVEKKEYK